MSLIDYNRIISKLTEVSSSVRQYIDNKEYIPPSIDIDDPEFNHLTNDDISVELTNTHILEICYKRLLIEFRDMGLIFQCSYDELVGDFYTAEKLIYLKEILIPYNLYNRLNDSDEFRKQIILLLESEDSNFFVSSFLNIMKNTFVFDMEVQEVYNLLWDRIFSEPEFIMYIKAILSNINEDEAEEIVYDVEEQVKLFDYINGIKQDYKNLLLEMINELNYDFDFNYLSKEIDKYNLSMVSSKNLNDYIWWINNKNNTESRDRYLELCNKHEMSNKQYIPHWDNIRKEEEIDLNDIVLLYFGTKEKIKYRNSDEVVTVVLIGFIRNNMKRLNEYLLNNYETIINDIYNLDISVL